MEHFFNQHQWNGGTRKWKLRFPTPILLAWLLAYGRHSLNFPTRKSFEAVRKSGDRYSNPDVRMGYGIPNMRLAYEMLEKESKIRKAKAILKADRLKIYPNPMTDQFTIVYNAKANGKLSFQLLSMEGKLIRNISFDVVENEYYFFNVNGLDTLASGQYILSYQDSLGAGTLRIMK